MKLKRCSFALLLCLGLANASNSANVNFEFGSRVESVSDAIQDILTGSEYHLADYSSQDQYAQDILSKKLNSKQRIINTGSIQQEILSLVGDDFNIIIDNANNELSLRSKKTLVNNDKISNDTDVSVDKVSVIDEYSKLTDYEVRVAAPLIKDLGFKPTKDELEDYYKNNNTLSFSFNNKNGIVAVAETEKQAIALAHKNQEVFFAISGDTLKQTIERWAEQAGYKAVYLATKDLLITNTTAFYGLFDSQTGALAELISTSVETGMNIQAQFSSNRVVVIKNNTYSSILLGAESNA